MLLRLAMLLALFAGAHSFGQFNPNYMTHEEHDEVAPTQTPTPTSTTICVDSEDDLGNGYGFCYEWAEELIDDDLIDLLYYGGYSAEEIDYICEQCPVACKVEGCV